MAIRSLPLRLSDEAREGLKSFADDHGVTVTGLVEALGLTLPSGLKLPPNVIREARKIDAERRQRGHTPHQ